MQTVHTIQAVRDFVKQAKQQGKRVGFVPTMGNLHSGHIHLISQAKAQCDVVICSILCANLETRGNRTQTF